MKGFLKYIDRVVECSDLMVVNGACNPYAVVVLSWGKLRHKEVKRTVVRKKTICPQFDDVFCFDVCCFVKEFKRVSSILFIVKIVYV